MDSKLSSNIQQQTKKLIDQLNELEELKNELDPEEYTEMKNDTLAQLEAFEKGLEDMAKNNLSIQDQAHKSKEILQKAIKAAFNTKSLKQNMSNNEASNKQLERDKNLQRIEKDEYVKQKLIYINHLVELNTELTDKEAHFLNKHTGRGNFVQHDGTKQIGDKFLGEAQKQVHENK